MSVQIEDQVVVSCHHCGDPCESEHIRYENKDFCCAGCKAVYELFQETELKDIYAQRREFTRSTDRFDFLENKDITCELLDFQSETHNRVKLYLPAIHCSSCIYLLENLHRLDKGIIRVTVNFVKKEADILYKPGILTLKDVAILLASIGYAPNFTKNNQAGEGVTGDNGLSIKLGVAAFCFGNIMLLSFPEYLGFDNALDEKYSIFFSWLNIVLALPVLFYSSQDYFISAVKGLQKRFVNIDVPIALGIITLFVRSTYEVLSATGPGYFDSLAGLVFFLLIGKWFQGKTYQNLSFERDYKSYFPLASLKLVGQEEMSTPIDKLEKGDLVVVRNGEIIPADGILTHGEARIDYSFVTGESRPIKVKHGEILYAGGRQLGQRIQTRLMRKSSQSYLTSLWNSQVFKTEEDGYAKLLVNKVSKYFTAIVLSIALAAFGYWFFADKTVMWQAFTAVLIVACPCALALSAPFTNGNVLRWMGKTNLYLKGANVIESLAAVDTLVFDKTGTLTSNDSRVSYSGVELSELELSVLKAMTSNSTHPISQRIHHFISSDMKVVLEDFNELPGRGLEATYSNAEFKLGSQKWLGEKSSYKPEVGNVVWKVNGKIRGAFSIGNRYRNGLSVLASELSNYDVRVISGDNEHEKEALREVIGDVPMVFRQSPEDKMTYIADLKKQGKSVMMLGDGLNDAGALKQSDVGIAVTEDIASFTPACDGILLGVELRKLSNILRLSSTSKKIVIASFILSFIYNVIGVSLAVSGLLTPVFAAVLMPLSSISVVLFTTISSNYFARKLNIA